MSGLKTASKHSFFSFPIKKDVIKTLYKFDIYETKVETLLNIGTCFADSKLISIDNIRKFTGSRN